MPSSFALKAVATPTLPSSKSSGTAIVETALDASKVARKLIDWARRATAVEGDQAGPESPVVDLNQLVREKLESEMSMASDRVDWVLNLGSIPPIPGDAGGAGGHAGLSAAKRSRGVARRCGNDRGLHLHRPSKLAGPRDPRHGMRNEPGSPETRDRAFFQHQARPRRRRPDDRAGNLAPASRLSVDRQPNRAWERPFGFRSDRSSPSLRVRRHDRHHRLWNG